MLKEFKEGLITIVNISKKMESVEKTNKNNQIQILLFQSTVNKIKKLPERLNCIFELAETKINELEDRLINIIKCKEKRGKKNKEKWTWLQKNCCSAAKLCWTFVTPWTAACQASLSCSLLKLMSIDLVMPSNHLVFCHPLLLSSIFPTIRVFSNGLAVRIRWPKHWNFRFDISSSSDYSGLISFRIESFDLLAIQGTFESILQYHSLKALILQCSAFFMVQLSYLYMTTGKPWLWLDRLCQQNNVSAF